ncbi:hypothetical protein F8388_019172 [Cannabis sativa]|uniref:Bet v I/Major latex protein domain-containing protein n=1 Tax=Cannabis sativa TaxID=3483 RepID=A0A7J6EBE9_CANSA|nr:hypothetical protein F8388_019172 [Cannabis sativa]
MRGERRTEGKGGGKKEGDGEKKVAKQIIEAIDDEKNSITFKVIEGDLLEHFKSFKATLKVTPKEYEKLHDEIIDPHTLLQLAIDLSKDLESHLLQA